MTTRRNTQMRENRLLRTGIVGTVVAALCCFTPLLVVLLGAVGLSAWLDWLDYVLFPALFDGRPPEARSPLNERGAEDVVCAWGAD